MVPYWGLLELRESLRPLFLHVRCPAPRHGRVIKGQLRQWNIPSTKVPGSPHSSNLHPRALFFTLLPCNGNALLTQPILSATDTTPLKSEVMIGQILVPPPPCIDGGGCIRGVVCPSRFLGWVMLHPGRIMVLPVPLSPTHPHTVEAAPGLEDGPRSSWRVGARLGRSGKCL
jgi:hypothetical protein